LIFIDELFFCFLYYLSEFQEDLEIV